MFTGPAFRSEPCFFLPHLTQRQARSLRSGLFYEECPLSQCPNVPLSPRKPWIWLNGFPRSLFNKTRVKKIMGHWDIGTLGQMFFCIVRCERGRSANGLLWIIIYIINIYINNIYNNFNRQYLSWVNDQNTMSLCPIVPMSHPYLLASFVIWLRRIPPCKA